MIPSPAALDGDTTNIAASVHNYMESITDGLTLEQMNDFIESITAGLGVAHWTGEYGFWDTDPDTLATARRYAADEDAQLWGGAWWQWRQSCGDPHAVRWSGGEVVAPDRHGGRTSTSSAARATSTSVPTTRFLDIVGRGYPRAAPGRLVSLRSDPGTGLMKVEATASEAGGRAGRVDPDRRRVPTTRCTSSGLTDVVEEAGPRRAASSPRRWPRPAGTCCGSASPTSRCRRPAAHHLQHLVDLDQLDARAVRPRPGPDRSRRGGPEPGGLARPGRGPLHRLSDGPPARSSGPPRSGDAPVTVG